MFKNKLIAILLIVCVSVGVPLACCLCASAASEVYVEDLYKGNSVEYLLSNPKFEIIDYTNNQRFDYNGEGGGSELGFYFAPASSTGGITDRSKISLGLAGALLETYSPSYNVYYRFTFDIRVMWTASTLRSKYNLDILASTSVGGVDMVLSDTYTYVEFFTEEQVAGEFDTFYYTNTRTSAYLPNKSSFDMRLFSVAPNRLRVTITVRLLRGIPKNNRSIDLQFIINSEEAAAAYIPRVDYGSYDEYYAAEGALSNQADNRFNSSFNSMVDDDIFREDDVRTCFASNTYIFNTFIGYNPFIMYVVNVSIVVGCVAFCIGVAPRLLSSLNGFSNRGKSSKRS